MTEKMGGGYESATTGQLLNVTRAVGLSISALRVYFALIAILASRSAVGRETRKQGRNSKRENNFSITELTRLVSGVSERNVRAGLAELKKAGLATVTKKEISLNSFPTAETKEFMQENGIAQRVIPIPRRMLRFLAKSKKPCLILTTVAYMMRGLYKHRREIKNSGTVKASWIAEIFGISESSVKNSRRELIQLGFITPDTTESQRKLNRTGAYFSINLDWNYQQEAEESGGEVSEKCRDFAPPHAKKCRDFAPPYKKQLTPYRSLETNKPDSRTSGFCKTKVSFRNIKQEDIKKIPLLLLLYQSAVEQKVFNHSERNLLSFFATAVKAKRSWDNSIGIFVWTVRNNFKFINDSDEAQAEIALKKYRASKPEAFSFLDSQPPESQNQPKTELKELISSLTEKMRVSV